MGSDDGDFALCLEFSKCIIKPSKDMSGIIALDKREEIEIVARLGVVDNDVNFVHDFPITQLKLLGVASVFEVLLS